MNFLILACFIMLLVLTKEVKRKNKEELEKEYQRGYQDGLKSASASIESKEDE